MAPELSEKCKMQKLAQNPPKSDKRIKQMSIPPFWGDVGIKKWPPFFCFGIRSATFWHLKTGTFGESALFQVPKMGLLAPKSKNEDHFFTQTSPKNGGLHICFVRLSLLGGFYANFEKNGFFGQFWSHFPSLTAKKLKVPFYNGRWAQIKKCKKTN